MFKKITTLISFIGMSGLFSACSPLISVVQTDNLTCTKSIVNGAMEIAWQDYDLPISYKKSFFNLENKFIPIYYNKEFSTFEMEFEPKFKGSTKRIYFYFIEKRSNECWTKLYKKDISYEDWEVNMSSIVFGLDSYKLDLCNCSDNSIEFGL